MDFFSGCNDETVQRNRELLSTMKEMLQVVQEFDSIMEKLRSKGIDLTFNAESVATLREHVANVRFAINPSSGVEGG